MKRIIALFLSILMALSLMPSVFAAGVTDTQISFDLTCDGKHTITVPTGTSITVNLSLSNKTDHNTPFNVESIYNDIKIDNRFFEIDDDLIESDVISNAFFQADDRMQKWARFNGYHIDPGERTYTSDEVVGSFQLKVKATSGQTTISSTSLSLYSDNYKSYQLTSEDLTVIVGETPPTLYTVKYMHNNAIYKTAQMSGQITVDAIPSPALEGYRFLGWEYNGTLYQPGNTLDVTGDVIFTAKWEKIIITTNRTLTFNTNGGTAYNTLTVAEGSVVDLTAYNPTKTGFTFEGWYTDEELTNKVTSITVDSDKTIYAKWEEIIAATYTLTFDTNGGSLYEALTRNEGTVIDLSSYKPTKSGYTFGGWYKDSALTQSVTSITLNSNITVYAKWTKSDVGGSTGGGGGGGAVTTKKFTLTFDTDGGSAVDSLEAKEGTKIALDKYVSEKSGYKFDGWYSDKELTKKVTEVTLNKDMTVYAKWAVSGDEPVVVKPDYKPGILTDEHYAYIVGREGGMIAPESDITRAEVATIIYRLLDEDERNKAKTKENVFADVNEEDWFNTAVSTLASLELVKGRTTDAFAPNAFITRAELATIFARMVEVEYDDKVLFSDVSGHWAESYIGEAAAAEWIVGYNGLFRPDDNITRAEVMTLVNRVLNREPESKADLLDGMTTWKDNADENAWYYLAVQEATNSHTCEMKADGKHEKWTSLTENPDWSKFED